MLDPYLSSILAVVYIALGAVAVWLMWDLKGNPKERVLRNRIKTAHRILGFIFVTIYLVMVFFMVRKLSYYQGEFTARAILHCVMAAGLLPLIVFKILIVRRLAYFTGYLATLGTGIFLIALVLVAVTAGRYFIYLPDWKFVTYSKFDEEILNSTTGERFMYAKCQKCHSLERVMWATHDQMGWTKTVNRMGYHDFPNLKAFEIKQLIYLFTERDKARLQQDAANATLHPGKKVVAAKCTACHSPDRIIKAQRTKSEAQWQDTINRMVEKTGDDDYLNPVQLQLILSFVLDRKVEIDASKEAPIEALLPKPEAEAVWKYFTNQNNYRSWSHFEGDEGIQPGIAPHGPAHAVFINKEMATSPRNKARHGSLVVKESYGRDIQLKNYTIMYKYEGYNPEAGDWFWAKYSPQGELSDQGKIAFCIECHAKRDKTDYLFLQLDLK